MSLTPDAIARIRSSFNLVAPHADKLMETFYSNLFKKYPQVRSMFPKDMTDQKKHLAAAIGLVVKHADNLGAIEKPLQEMGQRHVGYKVTPEQYPLVRETLMDSLAQVAGKAFTPQLRGDWSAAVNAVAGVMLEGAAMKKAA